MTSAAASMIRRRAACWLGVQADSCSEVVAVIASAWHPGGAQRGTPDLAGVVTQRLVDELEGAGHLVRGQVRSQVRPQVVQIEGDARGVDDGVHRVPQVV